MFSCSDLMLAGDDGDDVDDVDDEDDDVDDEIEICIKY